jgi:aspartate/methionine/tyrosine aminotransferase
VMTAMLAATDHAIVLTPCYQSLLSLPKSRCQVTQINLLPSDHWVCDLNAIRAAIKPNTKLIVMNWPHNPTGQVPLQAHWEGIISIAREHDIWIFSDEVYRGLETIEARRLPTLASVYEKGISLGVVSKSIGLAGLRVGWIAGQDHSTLNAIADVKHYLSICNSAPSEILSLIALRNYHTLLGRILDIVRGNLALIDSFMDRWDTHFRWDRPVGGCCGFIEMTNSSISMDELAKQLVESHGVLIIPGSIFASPAGTDDISASSDVKNFFRIGFGRSNFAECLNAFENALTKIFKRE